MLDQIAQILDDLFGIPTHMVEETDDLSDDWGLTPAEMAKFNAEFSAEFGIYSIPVNLRTISEYTSLVTK